jgi:histidinol-phosphate phosphatase family protein
MKKAVFLDKDGTLIVDVPYNVDPALVKLSPESTGGLKLLQENGYVLLVISNQSGIARGYFTEEALIPAREKLYQLLAEQGVFLNGFYYCPHTDEDACECGKPRPGMLFGAAEDMNIDLSGSWMIGDILNDVEAGNRAGCRTILIDNSNETEWLLNQSRTPTKICSTIDDAAAHILAS